MEGIHGLKRSLFCGQLRAEHAGRQVTLMGWVARCRNLGGMVFVTLRDKMGVAQVIFDENTPRELFEQAEGLHSGLRRPGGHGAPARRAGSQPQHAHRRGGGGSPRAARPQPQRGAALPGG